MTPVLGILGALLTLASAAAFFRVPAGWNAYRVQTAGLAYASLVVAGAIARTTHPVPQLIVYLLLTFAAARLLIPSFFSGPIHVLLAVAAFAAIAWCAIALPHRVDWLHDTLSVLGWIVLASAIACVLLCFLGREAAPIAAALHAPILLWFLVVSLHFL